MTKADRKWGQQKTLNTHGPQHWKKWVKGKPLEKKKKDDKKREKESRY